MYVGMTEESCHIKHFPENEMLWACGRPMGTSVGILPPGTSGQSKHAQVRKMSLLHILQEKNLNDVNSCNRLS